MVALPKWGILGDVNLAIRGPGIFPDMKLQRVGKDAGHGGLSAPSTEEDILLKVESKSLFFSERYRRFRRRQLQRS